MRRLPMVVVVLCACGGTEQPREEPRGFHMPERAEDVEAEEGAAEAEPEPTPTPDPFAEAPTLSIRQLDHLAGATDTDHMLGDLDGMGVAAECTDGDWERQDSPHVEWRDCEPAPIRVGEVNAYLVVSRSRAIDDPDRSSSGRIELRAPPDAEGWLVAIEAALTPTATDDPLASEVHVSDLEDGGRWMRIGARVNVFVPATDETPAVVTLSLHRRPLLR